MLGFSIDAAAGELTRAQAVLTRVKRGTLIGDRLYAMGAFLEELRQKRLEALFRRLRRLGRKPLRKKGWKGGLLTEWLVNAGSGVSAPVEAA